MKFFTLTFISTFLIYSNVKAQANRTTYKISGNKDSIVLVGTYPIHLQLQIFREKKKILDYTEKDFEVISIDAYGNNANWFTEYRGLEHFYIIRVFTGPHPDRFLIIKITDSSATVFGTTEPNSAEIFGDVDHDGKFEIGGLNEWCQGGDPNCHAIDHYRVFEVAPNFPTDVTLTNYFKQFLKKK